MNIEDVKKEWVFRLRYYSDASVASWAITKIPALLKVAEAAFDVRVEHGVEYELKELNEALEELLK